METLRSDDNQQHSRQHRCFLKRMEVSIKGWGGLVCDLSMKDPVDF